MSLRKNHLRLLRLPSLLFLGMLMGPVMGQTLNQEDNPTGPENPSNTNSALPTPATNAAPVAPAHPATPASAADTLAQSNRDLLDLLKKQQAVLEDIQYDRRLLNRQIQLLEERLEDTLQENAQLQAKIAKLEAEAAAPPPSTPANSSTPTPAPATASSAPPAPPPPPSTYLPPADLAPGPGIQYWHRILTLSGTDAQTTDLFHIQNREWRVVWHNQDKPGDTYKNTSALFINAFPKDDTIPQKVCAKLGSGGDTTSLVGPGNYYLKIEASGGKWELAVEDFY